MVTKREKAKMALNFLNALNDWIN